MQDGNLELIVTLVSIIGANLCAIFGAFGFLHREMRRGFEKVDQRFEKVEKKFDQELGALRTDVGALQVSVARIEGHLGLVALPPAAQLTAGEPPAQSA